jgi:hypothetical protein
MRIFDTNAKGLFFTLKEAARRSTTVNGSSSCQPGDAHVLSGTVALSRKQRGGGTVRSLSGLGVRSAQHHG